MRQRTTIVRQSIIIVAIVLCHLHINNIVVLHGSSIAYRNYLLKKEILIDVAKECSVVRTQK